MMDRRSLLLTGTVAAIGGGWILSRNSARAAPGTYPVQLSAAQWHAKLSSPAYAVLREDQTEAPETSPLLNEHRRGRFICAGCDQALYSSTTKFDSGTGWPSFYAPLAHAIATRQDVSMIIPRTEVHCSRCGGHLGHVFDDGPKPTGLRYCMNGVAMKFQPA